MFPNRHSNINFTHVLKTSNRDLNLKFVLLLLTCFEEPVLFVRTIYRNVVDSNIKKYI